MLKKTVLIIILSFLSLVATGSTVVRLPADKLDAPLLFGSRVVDVNRPWGKVFAPGQRNPDPVLMRFRIDKSGKKIVMTPEESHQTCSRGRRRYIKPVQFPLVGKASDGAYLIDVSRYFREYPVQVSAVPPKMLESDPLVSGEILSAATTDRYLQVKGRYRYSSGLEVTAACYILFLPEKPMPAGKVEGYNVVNGHSQRWDLSRRPHIDFYVDRSFPEGWYPYIKEGLEDWNRAFEKIGLGKVITVHPEPSDGSLDRTSPLVNMVRYMDVDEANAKGDVLTDPRSGEILQGDILWWKDVLKLITGWRYVQTGAADPSARLKEYPMEILGPMIRHSVCHEMGHVLGLNHNMGASWSYPTKSLRSPSFTQRYGTAASVMDYARYNHIATAEDVDKGVSLLPPRIGPYDYYAIALGYSDKKPVKGEYCYYAPFYSAAISPDPSSQAESLGNDLIASSAAGLRNCRALLKLDGLDDERLDLLRKQYYRYIWLALSNIGGVTGGIPVPWKEQKRTLSFVMENLAAVPPELADPVQERRILNELEGNFLPKRVSDNLGPKALEKYNTRVAGLKKKYNLNNKQSVL